MNSIYMKKSFDKLGNMKLFGSDSHVKGIN